jgi:hypothetical protein
LPESVEAKLTTEAQRHGVGAAQYAAELITQALVKPSVDEILAPFRKQVADSGLSDEQLDGLFEGLREKASRNGLGRDVLRQCAVAA